MNIGIELIASNLYTSFENIVLIIVLLGTLPFYARDFKVGLIITFVASGGLFMWFYEAGYTYVFAITIFFISLILMAFTLYAAKDTQVQGGFI